MLVVVIKKTKKISRSSFACWELSRVNSFISFLSFGGQEEKTILKMLSGSLNLEPILLVFSLELNACRFQLSLMHVHYYYYYSHCLVVQVKGNNDNI